MPTDAQLLGDYAETRSEEAFREIVERHLNLVYSTALRLLNGDAHRAQDVAQTVFADLARHARGQSRIDVLGGWLYRHAYFTALKVVRSERRRQFHEREAVNSLPTNTGPANEAAWRQIAPLLDQGLNWLNPTDRDALILRYFEQKDLRTVGTALGLSDDAAQKRVARALEKLRAFLARKGTQIEVGILASCLASQAVVSAPPFLGSSIASAALACGTAAGLSFAGKIVTTLTMAKFKLGLAVITFAGLLTSVLVQQHHLNQLREQNAALSALQAGLSAARTKAPAPAPDLDPAAQARLDREHRELLRLRGEVSLLRHEVQRQRAATPAPQAKATTDPAKNEASSPVERFTATLHSRIPAGQTLITGGWRTEPGKRTLVLVTPQMEPGAVGSRSVTITAKFFAAPDEMLAEVGLDGYKTDEKETSRGGLLTEEEVLTLQKSLEAAAGADVLGAPRVTTLEGRQAQIQVNERVTLPESQEAVDLGPSVDLVPQISEDGQSIDLTVITQFTQLKPGQKAISSSPAGLFHRTEPEANHP